MMSIERTLIERLRRELDRDDAVAFLQAAVARQSVTGNEANFAAFLEARMAALSLAPQRADFQPGRPNVWGERAGRGGGPRLLFVGHTDTVHVRGWKERWAGTSREDPFGGAVVDGAVWGRGSGDLKAGICASLAALDLIDRAGLQLVGDISYAFVGDEESGEPGSGLSAGIKDYAARVDAGDIAHPDFAVYVEPTRLSIFAAQMGFFIADVTITGRSAYFGVPEQGVDALKASHTLLSALWRHSEAISGRACHDLVGRAFLLVTEIAAGGYIAVPGEARLSLIRKVLPGETLDQAVTEFETVVRGVAVQDGIDIDIRYPAGRDHSQGGSPSQVDATLAEIRQLSASLDAALPDRGGIEGAPFWSETPFLIDGIGCPAVYCAPGDITNCHTLEERVDVDEYLAGIVAFASFIACYCGVVESDTP